MDKVVYGVEVIQPDELFGKEIVRYTDDAKDIKSLADWHNRFPYNEIAIVDIKDKNNIKEIYYFSDKFEKRFTSIKGAIKYFEGIAEEPMLRVPKFYYKIEDKENNNYIFKFSNTKIDDTWHCLKAFINNGEEKDYIYIGAVHGKNYDEAKSKIKDGYITFNQDQVFMFDMLRFLLIPTIEGALNE